MLAETQMVNYFVSAGTIIMASVRKGIRLKGEGKLFQSLKNKSIPYSKFQAYGDDHTHNDAR